MYPFLSENVKRGKQPYSGPRFLVEKNLKIIFWQGSDEHDLVTTKEANQKCPQTVNDLKTTRILIAYEPFFQVIKFYEDRLTWDSTGGEDGDRDDSNRDDST